VPQKIGGEDWKDHRDATSEGPAPMNVKERNGKGKGGGEKKGSTLEGVGETPAQSITHVHGRGGTMA